jgi:hypothetical protein
MENAYYFSQGRLIPNNTYKNNVGTKNASCIKNGNGNNDIEMGNTKDTKDTMDNWGTGDNNTNNRWYNLSLFRPRKFQIFSSSILRYK